MREWLEKNEEKLSEDEKITAVFLIYVRKIYNRIRVYLSARNIIKQTTIINLSSVKFNGKLKNGRLCSCFLFI